MMEKTKVIVIDYHRNGICGRPMYVALVKDPSVPNTLLVIRPFKASAKDGTECYVIDPKLAAEGEIRFCYNSWRGDNYAELMDKAIAEFEKEGRK